MKRDVPAVRLMDLPPQNLQSELEVLGACMRSHAIADELLALLTSGDFYRDWNGRIFDAIRSLRADREPTDAVATQERLAQMGEDVSLDELNRILMNSVYAEVEAAAYHAAIVRQKAVGREIIRICEEARARAYAQEDATDEQLDALMASFMALSESGATSQVRSLAEVIAESWAEMEARKDGTQSGPTSGIDHLDRMLGAFNDGELIIVAARPSMGKTALALQIAHDIAVRQMGSALFFSLEMSRARLGDRLLAMHSGVSADFIKSPASMSRQQETALERAREALDGPQLWVDDSFARSISAIAATARRVASRHGLSAVVVDYLQLIEGDRSGGSEASRQVVVAGMSRDLKRLARDLRIPVICLSQLNRESEKRADKRPFMSDLRESGAIEQDADVVILVHRPDYYDPSDNPGGAEIIVAKNRSGQTGTVQLNWVGELYRFESAPSSLNSIERRAFDAPY